MEPEIVIIRAFRGQPSKGVVLEVRVDRAAVASPTCLKKIASGEMSPISLPLCDLFEFSEDVFERLKCEWDSSGGVAAKTWSQLRKWSAHA